jgi:dipeptidyl aminopeptidase/acylaminoacyl peptidase
LKGGIVKKSASILVSIVLFLAAGAEGGRLSAQTRKPLTFDDFIKIKRLSDVRPSPDGASLAFVVTEMDKEDNRGNSDVWLLPSKGGDPRRLTNSPASDTAPRWSPDGSKIAFISSRSGSPQVWIISPAGGEAYQLSNISTDASGVIWSPDGKAVLFASSVYPDCPDDECNKAKADAWEKSRVKTRLYDGLLIRHWNVWRIGTRSHLFLLPVEGGKAVDLTPGDFDTPPIDSGSDQDYAFFPDGTEIAFVRNIDPDFRLALGTNNDIFVTTAHGGGIKPITTSKANDNSPSYSPDGKYIAYRAMARPGFEADKYDLMLYDRKAQTSRNLTETLDDSVDEIIWAKDSAQVFFTAEEKGRNALFKVATAENKPEKILDGHTFGSLSLLPDGKTFVMLKQAMNRPADIFAFDVLTKRLSQLTDINRDLLARLDMNPAEEFWFVGAAEDRIHGWLVKPPAFDPSKKYPLVMLIHGGPQGAWKDEFHYRWNAQMFAAPGYAVAMINFHGSTGYGQRFTDSITGDWGGKPYQDIVRGTDYVVHQYPFIDGTKKAAAGASYGGYMIDWIEGQTDLFNCLVTHSGVFDLRSMYGATEELWFPEWEFLGTPWTSPEQYTKWSPSSNVKNFKTPCLVIHGQNDFRVPLEQGLQMYTALQRMRVPSEFLYFPDEDHFVQKPQNAELWWKTVLAWIASYLK